MTSRTFRVFISSTFTDFIQERNALNKDVWPTLKELCERKGFRFQAIDLRWGLSNEATLDQKTASICLRELRHCQQMSPRPNFLVLVGNRYGWCPLPDSLPAQDFDLLAACAREMNSPHVELLFDWYRLDENAVPTARYLRPRNYHGVEADGAWWLREVEQPLRVLLETCAKSLWGVDDARRLAFTRSLTEREILAGAFHPSRRQSLDHVFAYIRRVTAFDQVKAPTPDEIRCLRPFLDWGPDDQPDTTARILLLDLKQRLRRTLGEEQIRDIDAHWTADSLTTDHLNKFCNLVKNDLCRVIEQEIANFQKIAPLDTEIAAHRKFAAALAGDDGGGRSRYPGRVDLLQPLVQYMRTAEAQRPLLVTGPAGCGKSTLLAQASLQAWADQSLENQRPIIIRRFIGATPASFDSHALLQGICEELKCEFSDEVVLSSDYRELVAMFHRYLAKATVERPIAIFVDALDQLTASRQAVDLTWLPVRLPPHVYFVVSALCDPSHDAVVTRSVEPPTEQSELKTLIERYEQLGCSHIRVTDLPLEYAHGLLDFWLSAEHRRITSEQRQLIFDAFLRCPRPLFLRLAAAEAQQWRSDSIDALLPSAPTPDEMLNAVIHQLFDRLSQKSQHGALLVGRVGGYLAAAKNGLTEDELIGLLSSDVEFFRQFQSDAEHVKQPLPPDVQTVPIAVWCRLHADLQPYLTTHFADGTTLLRFSHRVVAEVARKRFLNSPKDIIHYHDQLASYFEPRNPASFFLSSAETPAPLRASSLAGSPRIARWRQLEELPFHRIQVARLTSADDISTNSWNRVFDLLFDLNFLEAKVESPTYLFSLLEDLRSARAELPHHLPVAKRLTVLREIIWRSATLLLEHPTMLLQCLCNEGGWDNVAATRHEARPFSKSEQTALQAMRLMAQPLAFPAIKRVLARRRTGLSGFSTLLHGWWFRKISEQKSWTWLHALRPSDRVSGAITKAIIRVHSAAVYCLSVTSDLSISVTASADGTIRIVDLAQQREVVRIAHPHGRVSAIALFPDGERFAAASWEDDACLVYDRATGTLLFSHRTAPALPVSLAISPDGAMIAMGCSDGTIQVVDASCQRVIQRWAAHLGSVMALAFSRTGEMLVSGAREQESIRVWHTADWTQATVVQPASVGRAYRNFEVESVACSPTRNMFASGHVDGSIRLWSLPEGELLRTFQGITWPVLSISFSADGQRLIAGGHNGESLVWDTETATVVGVPSGQVGHVWGAFLSADGTSCVLAADDGAIRVFALQSGNFLAIENHRGGITGVMTIPDANQFVTVGYDGIVRIWGASTGELQMRFVAGNAIQSACTDSIRRIIYVYTSAGHLELFDLETGQQRISVRVNPAGMPGVIGLSEDGVTLALATSHQLRFFNCQPSCAAGQDEIQLVERHEPTGSRFDDITNLYLDNLKAPLATAITFSPDAANVAVGFEDGVVRLFAVRNARPMMTYLGLTEPIIEIALGDSDDSFLSAVTAKETVCWQQHHPQQPSYRGTVTDPREIATFSMGQGTHLGVTSLSAVLIIDSQNVAWFPASIRRIKRLGKSARWFVSDGNHVNVLESKSFQIRSVIEHADVTIWHFDSKTVVMAYHHSLLGEQPLNQFYHLIEEMVNLEIRHLILDFHRIRWMSSLALGGLVRISKTLQHNDVTISIVGLNDHNKGTILWCRLDERLRVFDAVEEAIRYGDRPLRRDRTELEIAISRLSGSERDILDAISDGRSAEAHQMMNGLLNIIGEESGWASLIAGLACRLAGTICALSQRWETGIRSFDQAQRVIAAHLGPDHPLTIECEEGLAYCFEHLEPSSE